MKLNRLFKISVSIFCLSWFFINIVMPASAYFYYKNDYMKLTNLCSRAMDEEWFSGQYDDENLAASSSVQLMYCHEYDKVRKKLLFSGVNENILSYLGLVSLELNQHSVEEYVNQHRFIER